MFIFESTQLIEQLEQFMLLSEKAGKFEAEVINEIFRIMHTIKGSSAMMFFENISTLAHSIEDLFFCIREHKPEKVDHKQLTDLVLKTIDFIKVELQKVQDDQAADGNPSQLVEASGKFLTSLKMDNNTTNITAPSTEAAVKAEEQKFYLMYSREEAKTAVTHYKAVIFFEDGCQMENIRAFTIIHNLKEIPGMAEELQYFPADIIEDEQSVQIIREKGFRLFIKSGKSMEALEAFFQQVIFLKSLTIEILADEPEKPHETGPEKQVNEKNQLNTKQSVISVHIAKLDKLMDLMGEMVISEAMVTQHPELNGLKLHGYRKAARQLRKITNELQDVVMSIRMVPLALCFHKMHRIVRDMGMKLNKEVKLEILGEETEVDKNIIDHLSDPLIHIIRNSLDHGIEAAEERRVKGKAAAGKITIEARSSSSDIWIVIKDDGRGLDRFKILKKAQERGLVTRPESELSDREVHSFIFAPGFSTKESVTEFSGRGVGMDVVTQNIGKIGGSILIDSQPDKGTAISLKIPLTLAIIDGMIIQVGSATYTLPTTSIKESFRPKEKDIINDPDNNEMIMIRGLCYPILRLHERFKAKAAVTRLHEGIIIMVETEDSGFCLFADALLGQQQVVVKSLPAYIKKVKGLAGCTLLGDGSISLILDVNELSA